MMSKSILVLLHCVLVAGSCCYGQTVLVTGGRSDATLDESVLALAGLNGLQFSSEVIDPSPRGNGFVGFEINGRDDMNQPTTFTYEVDDLFPVTGTVELSGSVFFNSVNPLLGFGVIEIGDFSIGHDPTRVSTLNSGFFVESTVGIQGILFDIAQGTGGTFPADEAGIQIESGLRVSAELAALLGDPSFAGSLVGTWGIDGVSVADAPSPTGDFNADGFVDLGDIDFYNGNIGQPASFNADLDLDGSGTIDEGDLAIHIETLVQTSNGNVGTAIGDINLDGVVNVLGDAFALVANLGNSATSWSQGDLNADQTVNVLGDAFKLVANLGFEN